MPPISPQIAAAGAQVANGFISSISQMLTNKSQLNYQTSMYDRQRADAKADWDMQNAYNSPAAQMERFKAAGLNPNLIYGQTNVAPPVRSSTPGAYHPDAPRFDVGSVVGAYQDAQIKGMQYSNMQKQNDLLDLQKLLLGANIDNTLARTSNVNTSTAQGQFELGLRQDLRTTTLEQAAATLNKTLADTRYTLDQNDRAAAANAVSIKEGLQRIVESRARTAYTNANTEAMPWRTSLTKAQMLEAMKRIDNMDKSGQLMQLDINLKKMGLQPGDELWQRMLGQALSNVLPNIKPLSNPDKVMDSLGVHPGYRIP